MLNDYPLFPLPLVAFPGCRLPLQIFEPRYLDLVKLSLSTNRSFGVVTLSSSQPKNDFPVFESIGTAVKIVDFNEQPNGLLGIVCEGAHKIYIRNASLADNDLVCADVEEMEDEPVLPVPPEFEDLVYVLDSLFKHPYVETLGYPSRSIDEWFLDAANLGFYLSYLLPFSTEIRYRLLSLELPFERLILIQSLLDDMDSQDS